MNVAVIGASDKPQRYSYQAVMLLKDAGHRVYPVHRRVKSIEGIAVFSSLEDIGDPLDTVTLYVNAAVSSGMAESILAKEPRRIIFNPGAENLDLQELARQHGIETLNACTLVMLKTGRF